MALPLIEALKDPDEGVVSEARQGLNLLSRKVDGFGPAASASPEQKEQAIARWRAWYEAVRPISTNADDSPPGPTPTKPAQPARRSP
jgi:hypothetical protein